ncbi:MAG: hypothetical protein IJ678_03945 [Kiritimatiellae bacterium]|nr:hypothetical protein [Kiritimatiellia bacterium]
MKLRIARIAAVPFWAVFFLPGCCRVSLQDTPTVSAETVLEPQGQISGHDKTSGCVRLSPALDVDLSLHPEAWNPGDSAVALAERLGEAFLRYKWSDSRVPVRGHAISMYEILTGNPYESEFSVNGIPFRDLSVSARPFRFKAVHDGKELESDWVLLRYERNGDFLFAVYVDMNAGIPSFSCNPPWPFPVFDVRDSLAALSDEERTQHRKFVDELPGNPLRKAGFTFEPPLCDHGISAVSGIRPDGSTRRPGDVDVDIRKTGTATNTVSVTRSVPTTRTRVP